MKDVAALAGVSLKTVSRVVNNESTVNEELATRVRAAAAQLHYQPNISASALRRLDGRSSTIAVLLEDLSNPFSATIYRSVEEVAIGRGVVVIGGSFDEDPERELTLTAAMARHRVDGFIIAPASRDHGYLAREKRAGTPFVFVDRPPVNVEADCVLSDSRDGVTRATRHLLRSGHRRIGFLGDLTTIYTAEERVAGFRDAMREAGLPIDPHLVHLDLRTAPAAEQVVGRLLDSAVPPTAIFAGQNLVLMGALRAIHSRHLQDRIAVVGFDDLIMADLLQPAITVVAQNPERIAHEAATLLFRRIDGDTSPTRQIVVTSELVIRGSGEIPASARD
jgi:LacI family transcriptional regulator